MPFAYMLRCSDGSFYVGSCRDLEVRFAQHQNGEGLRTPDGAGQ